MVQIAHSMRAEGATKIVVVTDEPEKYHGVSLPTDVAVKHRDALDDIQRELREIKGTTIIIYDQTCATEKRRRRKRGKMVDPAKRVLINDLVCEGCGDCGDQSNCLSVEPLDTPLGRKRQINQSTCNKDFSCVKGFCPSFVTVEGGQLKKKAKTTAANPFEGPELPYPTLPTLTNPWGIVVAGVGGTGVITIGQLLGVAAHIEGKGVITQDAAGLAQKGGATWSHIQIANHQTDIATTRVAMASADLILGCDPIVTAGKETLARMQAGRTHIALNAHATPTAAFVHNADWQNPAAACVETIAHTLGQTESELLSSFDADAVAKSLMGDTLYINPILLGYAWQKGWIPLALDSILRAMELNAVAVDNNKAAFTWGRRAAHDMEAVNKLLNPGQVVTFKKRETLTDLIAHRTEFLTQYQNAAYAKTYQDFVTQVQAAEQAAIGSSSRSGKTFLTENVARYLFKLMAYKDEYEVARLHSDFQTRIAEQFEGDYKLRFHLAPPLWAKKNAQGELQKTTYGALMLTAFKLLTKLKALRGTAFDIFGYSEERKTERALVTEYRDCITELLKTLSVTNHALAVEIARLPEAIRGYGHVKERSLAQTRIKWRSLLDAYKHPQTTKVAA